MLDWRHYRRIRKPSISKFFPKLGHVEDRIEFLNRRLEDNSPEPQLVPFDRLRHFVVEQTDRRVTLLLNARAMAKLALGTHLDPLACAERDTNRT